VPFNGIGQARHGAEQRGEAVAVQVSQFPAEVGRGRMTARVA
jgi:hypothetical protein